MPSSDSFLAVYGSLRRRSLAKQPFFVLRDLQFYGHGILKGLLLIQNGYPAVLEDPGQVRVEIFRLEGEGILEELDRYEGYLPALGSRSLFYRKEVALMRPEIRAWVYFLGREVPRGRRPVVCSAAWLQRQRIFAHGRRYHADQEFRRGISVSVSVSASGGRQEARSSGGRPQNRPPSKRTVCPARNLRKVA